jgi:hypothetical protein
LIGLDVIGAALLVWFIWDRKLVTRERLLAFLRTGRPPADEELVPAEQRL